MKSDNKPILAYGELLWDVLPTGAVLGGAPANFCFRLQTLGRPAVLVSRVGKDELGAKALGILRDNGVNISQVQVDPTIPTGTVDVKLSAEGNASYVINTGVAYDQIEVTDDLLSLARNCSVLCFGTLIQRTERSRSTLRRLIDAAGDALKLLDINLRRDCYTLETVTDSLRRTDILKLNDDEVKTVTKLLGLGAMDLRQFADHIIEKFELQSCLITRGAGGVFARSAAEEECDLPGYAVPVADTIGSGDAFTAGFVDAFLSGRTLRDSCDAGNKLGALVATRKGGMAKITADEIAQFSHQFAA